jgi:hypothetical protein
LKSPNNLKFENIKLNSADNNESALIRRSVNDIFKSLNKERIYTNILLCKASTMNNGIKINLDKVLKNFTEIRNNKNMYNELRSHLDKEVNETLNCLYDSLVQLLDREIYKKLKNLFYDIDWHNYDDAISFRLDLRNLCHELFFLKCELYEILNDERKEYEESNTSTLNEAMMWKNTHKRLSKYQKEMECLHIRRLSIYNSNSGSPQTILFTIAKIFLKDINEFIKLKKFSKEGFQQVQLDMNLIKYFFRDYLIIDVEKILDGFYLEILKNSSSNCLNPDLFDEMVFILFNFS